MGITRWLTAALAILLLLFGIYTVTLSQDGPGDIVSRTGPLIIEQDPVDPEFKVTAHSPILVRRVEMYQYYDTGSSIAEQFFDKPELIQSKNTTYANPGFPSEPKNTVFYGKVRIGKDGPYLNGPLLLPFSFENYVNFAEPLPQVAVGGAGSAGEVYGLKPLDEFTYSNSPDGHWEIGDVRVTWYAVDPERLAPVYSAFGGLQGDTLGDDDHVAEIFEGKKELDEFLQDFETGNFWVGIGLIVVGGIGAFFALRPLFSR